MSVMAYKCLLRIFRDIKDIGKVMDTCQPVKVASDEITIIANK
jgi:hypothetical protein